MLCHLVFFLAQVFQLDKPGYRLEACLPTYNILMSLWWGSEQELQIISSCSFLVDVEDWQASVKW